MRYTVIDGEVISENGRLHPPALMRYAPTPHLRAQDEHIGSDSRTEVRDWPQA